MICEFLDTAFFLPLQTVSFVWEMEDGLLTQANGYQVPT